MIGFYIRLSAATIFFLIFYIGLHRLFTRLKFKGAGYIFFFLVLLSPLALNTIYHFVPFYYQETYGGRVVDAKTGKPVPGAAVLAVYRDTGGLFISDNDRIRQVRETSTAEDGTFSLPGNWSISFTKKGTPWATLTIFKPGFAALDKGWNMVFSRLASYRKKRTGRADDFVYALTPLTTDQARLINIYRMNEFDEIPFAERKNYMALLNQERLSHGLAALE